MIGSAAPDAAPAPRAEAPRVIPSRTFVPVPQPARDPVDTWLSSVDEVTSLDRLAARAPGASPDVIRPDRLVALAAAPSDSATSARVRAGFVLRREPMPRTAI